MHALANNLIQSAIGSYSIGAKSYPAAFAMAQLFLRLVRRPRVYGWSLMAPALGLRHLPWTSRQL